MFDDTFKSIKSQSDGLFKDKGSRFLAFAYPVKSEDEIRERLAWLRKEYHDARHHCYAYRLGHDKQAWRINDDGEPSGTAGRPIFGQIQSFDLTNILVVVVRYFGGIKLGVSGLINAYKTASRTAIENAEIIEMQIIEEYKLHFGYPVMSDVMGAIKEMGLDVRSSDFHLDCYLEFRVRKAHSNAAFEKFSKMKGVNIEFLKIC
jgi:uncharacterized YigZ family protein